MANDILCPTCAHSLAFHSYDHGSCEAPLGGLTSKNMCGCPFTIHAYIQNLQAKDKTKEFEQLDERYKTCMDEITNAYTVTTLASNYIKFLKSKLKTIRELLDKIKSVEKMLGIGYKTEVIKIVNEIILELEKDMVNEQYDTNRRSFDRSSE
jgi:hypothetical protein